jgi:hypothetical protein
LIGAGGIVEVLEFAGLKEGITRDGEVVPVPGFAGGIELEDGPSCGATTPVAGRSVPNWAKGFDLPSVPSAVSTILESCKLLNASSEKIASSNFIFLTFNNRLRKSFATRVSFGVFVFIPEVFISGSGVVDDDETKLP